MKILLFLLLISTTAFSQEGIIHAYPEPIFKVPIVRLPVKLRQITEATVSSSKGAVYLFESDLESASVPETNIKIINIQIPISQTVTQEQKDKIKEILFGTTPLVLKQTIDDTNLQYSELNPTVNPPQPSLTSWNKFQKDVAINILWPDAFHNDTGTFSNAINTTATILFTGKKIKIWGEISDNKGIAGIKLNADPEQAKDLYATTDVNNSQVIYESTVLPQGNHSATIRVTGNKNPASTGTYVLIDKIEIFE